MKIPGLRQTTRAFLFWRRLHRHWAYWGNCFLTVDEKESARPGTTLPTGLWPTGRHSAQNNHQQHPHLLPKPT